VVGGRVGGDDDDEMEVRKRGKKERNENVAESE
jgi:hypothetical protein